MLLTGKKKKRAKYNWDLLILCSRLKSNTAPFRADPVVTFPLYTDGAHKKPHNPVHTNKTSEGTH